MTPGTPRNIGASVRARLLNLSRQTEEDYQFLLQRYAAERFLYRLGESEHRDNFVLKGAMLLALWGGGTYRPTRDLDFTAYGNSWEEHVRSTLQEICSIPAEDGVVFNSEEIRLETIRDHAVYNSFRAKLKASIGKTRISLQLDIGFGNSIQPSPVDSEYTTLLDHPPPRIRVYPPEAFVAEKLHAMVFHGERNTRHKDFYDIYTLAKHFDFDGECLTDAIVATFELRRTTISEAQPVALTPQFYADEDRAQEWRNYLARNKLLGAPSDFDMVGELLSKFLTVVWRAIANQSDFTGKWPAGGPWRKDSGIKWLGEIPLHWEVKQLKRLFDIRNGSTPRSAEPSYWNGDLTWVTPEDIGSSDEIVIHSSKRSITEAGLRSCGTSLIPEKSIVLSTRAPIGHIAIAGISLCTNQGCRGLVPRVNLSEGYYYYFFVAARSELQSLGQGSTYRELSKEHLSSMNVVAPDVPDQIAIARFLDRETGKIDVLVARKERLIELLQEKRATLITQAVNKGLAPDVPMKDSGEEWLGEIPAHWNVKPIRALAQSGYRTFTDGDWIESPFITDKGIRLIQTGNIGIGYYKEQGFRYISDGTFSDLRCTEVMPGDVLICRLADPVGRACVAPDLGCRMITSVDVCILKPKSDVDSSFLVYLLSACDYLEYLGAICRGGTRDRVSRSGLGSIRVRQPPFSEQRAISIFLDRETTKIDALVAKLRKSIVHLKDLRTALITAAVTGKIDVREATA